MARLGRVRVNFGCLAQALGFPAGWNIERVDSGFFYNEAILTVSGNDFSEVADGNVIPTVDIEVTAHPDGSRTAKVKQP